MIFGFLDLDCENVCVEKIQNNRSRDDFKKRII